MLSVEFQKCIEIHSIYGPCGYLGSNFIVLMASFTFSRVLSGAFIALFYWEAQTGGYEIGARWRVFAHVGDQN